MIFSWNSLILCQCIFGGGWEGCGGGVGGGKSLRKKTQIVEFRVANDMYMHPQRTNNLLQGLDRHALTEYITVIGM